VRLLHDDPAACGRSVWDDRHVMPVSVRDGAGPLLGRDVEIELVTSLLDSVPAGGGALVLRGEPGIGKSRLLAEAAALAREREFTVLSATGVQSEAHLAFSGLHQLLRPVRTHAAGLLPAQRAALDAAFGLDDEDATGQQFRLAMAVLDLLSEAAAAAPVLLVAEDAHWLDRPSLDVLAFVARRLESDPILLLAATRDGSDRAFGDAGLPEHRLGALDPVVAATLLDASAPDLPRSQRGRVLREAAGNPLALVELPLALPRLADRDAPIPGLLPLTERLEHAFAARVSELPDYTRLLLLVTALNDDDRLQEVLVTGSAVAGTTLEIDWLEPAVEASIVELDVRTVRFRHPLMRSAVSQAASVAQRQRVHEALADVLGGEPDRRVWHRAALITGEHEDVALELEEAGRRARRRGAIGVAVAAMRRAAELSEREQRARRLLATAELAFELGQPDVVFTLLSDADRLVLGPLGRARAMWIREMLDTRPLGDPARITAVLAAAEQAGSAEERDLQIDLLWLVASRSWWVDPDQAARKLLSEAAHRLGGADADDPRVVAIHAYADPFGHAPGVLARLRAAATEGGRDTEAARHFGPAALVVGAFDLGTDFLAAAVDGLRTEGRLGHLPRILALYSGMAARLADWDVAIPAAAEARRLATELREPQWEAAADTVVSLIAGMRGDEEAAEQAATRAERIAEPAGANITVAFAQFGRVLAALGAGRHADAYRSAERLFDPADSAYHPVICSWLIGDLAEAALHADRIEEGRARVAQVEAIAGASPGTWIQLGLGHARALLADDDEAEARFDEALGSGLARWPFQRARLLLNQGQWLRRRRRIADSRAPLRAARDGFDALGCAVWSDRARRELRASGEASRRRNPAARDQLTAQELQIAQLAAKGLSNREIGQRLYLSHRTIGTHLYRIFPKLGITGRSELQAVLNAAAGSPER
jgi:DNA-binding CsgD family transcriptional regulator